MRLPVFLTHGLACFTFVRTMLRSAQPRTKGLIEQQGMYRCVDTSAYVENPERVKIRKFGIR
jgi:hypothetical protein